MAFSRALRSAATIARRALPCLASPAGTFSSPPLILTEQPLAPLAVSQLCRSFSLQPNPIYNEVYNRQRQIQPLNHLVPDVAVDAWVAPNAVLLGGVTVEDGASVWYGAVLRGDLNYITVGAGSNVQEKVVIHPGSPSPEGLPSETRIGRHVTVGQGSVLTSCEIEDEVLIGQRTIVLEGALVEKNAIVGDGSVVTEGQLVPSGELWAGNPAKFVRVLSADEKAEIPKVADAIKVTAGEHAAEFLPFSSAYVDAEKLAESLAAARAARAKKVQQKT